MRASSRHRLLHASLALLILTFGCGGSPAESPTSPSLLEPAASNTAGARAGSPMGVPNDRYDGLAAESVDPDAGTLTLADGTVVTVFDATRWKTGGRWLSSLDEILVVLDAGEPVRVFGRGTREDASSILAARIRAKVRPGR